LVGDFGALQPVCVFIYAQLHAVHGHADGSEQKKSILSKETISSRSEDKSGRPLSFFLTV
jgi:hypothetical protein